MIKQTDIYEHAFRSHTLYSWSLYEHIIHRTILHIHDTLVLHVPRRDKTSSIYSKSAYNPGRIFTSN